MAVKTEITEAQKKMTHGVYVISTVADGRVNAMTAAWAARVSFVPPLVVVAVGHARHTHGMITKSGVFCVNVLGPENIELGRHFGLKTGRKFDKFEGIDYETRATGSPVIPGCVAWLDCRVHSTHEAGDHTLFIGETIDAGVMNDIAPLVYDRGTFFK